jgi:predicted amidophosphoribosyltransferase
LGCCPACGARFRGDATCSRCGADLARLMSLAASAFLARRQARRLLLAGDLRGALEQARQAQRLAATRAGEAVSRIASCLAAISR